MSDTFYTLKSMSESVFKDKMSKFLAFAHPVSSSQDAKLIIADYRKRYYDARHVCWAYKVGTDGREFLSSDDGEPSGTAGKPILGQITSFGLTNVVIVVVRYFGGIKLGTSGLIVAYRSAAREAIESGTIIECHEMRRLTISFPYLSMNDVMKSVKMRDVTILDQQFDNSCLLTIEMRADDVDAFIGKIENFAQVMQLE